MTLTDLESISNAALRVDSNPVGLAGRLLGLSASGQKAGVPGWAWLAIGLGVGVLAGVALNRSKILSRILDAG